MTRSRDLSYKHSTNVRSKGVEGWVARQAFKALSFGTPRLTERLIERLFFTPGRYAPSTEERQRLEQGELFEVRVHDKQLRGWRWGGGPGILLVHGWNGAGIQLHRFIDPLVRAGYSAIAFDGPAHGASEGRSTSYFEFTDAVRTLIEPGRGFDVHGIVAHSFGAGAVVNGLAHRKAAIKTVLLAPALKLKDLLFDAFDRHGVPSRIYEKIIAGYEARFGYNLERDDPHRRLDDLRAPVLVIHDRGDSVIAYRDSQALCGRLERMTLKTTSGLGHRKIMTDPEVVKAAVSHLLHSRDNASEATVQDIPGPERPVVFLRAEGDIHMNIVESIMDYYRSAGEEDRLDCYLAHPGLRDLFDAFEREERHPNSQESDSPG